MNSKTKGDAVLLKTVSVSALLILLLFSNGRFSLFFAPWLSSALMLFWVRRFPKIKGFLITWLLLSLVWSFQFYGMVPLPIPFTLGLSIFYGLLGSLPYLIDRLLVKDRKKFIETLIFPASWALIDSLIQYSPFGSWGQAAYSQHSQLVLLQSISIFGMGYITFLIGWFASFCNWVYAHRQNLAVVRRGGLIYGLLLLCTMCYGALRLTFNRPESETARIASLSADKKQDQKTDPELQKRFFANQLTSEDVSKIEKRAEAINDDLLNRSIKEAIAGAKIIFWGETNGTSLKQSEANWLQKASQIALEHQIYFGIGIGTMDPSSDKPLENKLVLFSPEGKKLIDYWKANPVPGGEASISATKNNKAIQTTNTPFGKIGAVICFDMDFPYQLRQARDVDVLLVPSNDWKAIDPWHTHMARFRAIEQGFNMVRQTSNGLSVGVDYTGQVISAMDHFTDRDKILVTHLPTKGVSTIYSITGEVFPFICLILLVFIRIRFAGMS